MYQEGLGFFPPRYNAALTLIGTETPKMTLTSVSAVIKTNAPRQSIKKDFLSKFTEHLCEIYNTEAKVGRKRWTNSRFVVLNHNVPI